MEFWQSWSDRNYLVHTYSSFQIKRLYHTLLLALDVVYTFKICCQFQLFLFVAINFLTIFLTVLSVIAFCWR